ncbi:MAG: ribulose-phosphate 3-epimerase [Bacteroidales bacterium]|nr:ribulose-phosphate 3-epimerase [Bacteroidales bacterium]
MKKMISVSILAANFLELGKDIEMLNKSEADWIHIDVMDGVFVPNFSFGMQITKRISGISKKPLDVHLMINDPHKYLKSFKDAGASLITVHFEARNDTQENIREIKSFGLKAGVVISPETSVIAFEKFIPDVDVFMLMSVHPGFGGQRFIERTYDKIKELKCLISSKSSNALIEVDGGVDLSNAKKLADAGADILVAGNSIFSSPDPVEYISELKEAIG